MAFDRPAEEGLDTLVPPQLACRLGSPASMSSPSRDTWLVEMPVPPIDGGAIAPLPVRDGRQQPAEGP